MSSIIYGQRAKRRNVENQLEMVVLYYCYTTLHDDTIEKDIVEKESLRVQYCTNTNTTLFFKRYEEGDSTTVERILDKVCYYKQNKIKF